MGRYYRSFNDMRGYLPTAHRYGKIANWFSSLSFLTIKLGLSWKTMTVYEMASEN